MGMNSTGFPTGTPGAVGSGQVGLSSGAQMVQSGGAQLGAAGVGAAADTGNAAMNQIQQTSAMQMKFQTEMGLLQLMVKMNEALAKLFKAIGEAIKGLA